MTALGCFPESNLVRGCRGEDALGRVSYHCPDAFFVVRQSLEALATPDVPQANHFIVAASNDLRLICLADN